MLQCPLSGNLSLTLPCWVKPQECASCFDGFTTGRSARKIRKSGALLCTVSSQAEIRHALLTLTLTCSQPVLCGSHVPRWGWDHLPNMGLPQTGMLGFSCCWDRRIGWFLPVVLDQFLVECFFALPESEACDIFCHGPCIGR